MNISAIYHRSTVDCCYAADRDTITVNLRTAKDVDRAWLVWEDPFIHELRRQRKWEGKRQEMSVLAELRHNYIWTVSVAPRYKRLRYSFIVESEGVEYAVCENRICPLSEAENGFMQCFKYAWLNSSDVIEPPKWVEKTIWYQIMPDRFHRASDSPSDTKFRTWGDMSDPKWNDIYGGDLRGITEKLDYIRELGFTGIYMTPIFYSGSNHKYNTYDYWQVDPDFGTEDDLRELISEAHKRGIRVMLDAVFNHCGSEFAPWRDVLEKGRGSKYYDWFFINSEDFAREDLSTEDARFYSFSFWAGMPKLNTNNPEVVEYFTKLCIYWAHDWQIDGIRFDVGDEVSHAFIRYLRDAVKSVNPDIYFLGEIWMDSIGWLGGAEYDAVMNYPFPNAVNDFFGNGDRSFEDLIFSLNYCRTLYPAQVTRCLLNFLDNHDTPRLASICSDDDDMLLRLAVLLTFPGSPCLYYGAEIAMQGMSSPYNRACMPWKEIDEGRFADFTERISALIGLRNLEPAFRSDELTFLPDPSHKRLVRYRKANKIEVALNASEEELPFEVKGNIFFQNNYSDGSLKKYGVVIYKTE